MKTTTSRPASPFRRFGLLGLVAVGLLGCPAEQKPSRDPAAPATSKPATVAATARPSAHRGPAVPAQKQLPAPEDVATPPADAEKTASGLVTKVLQAGSGEDMPKPSDKVKVHYTGWTKDGKMFDSSVTRGKPTEFQVGGVIKGWTEGLQLMVVGEERRLWIPSELAYAGKPGRPQGMLVFDVELLEILD